MKKIINLLLFSLIILLTSCWDYKELDSTEYITTIGIDYEEDKIVLYTNVINPLSLSKVEVSGVADNKSNALGKTSCDVFFECLTNIKNSTVNKLNEFYLSSLVISFEYIENNGIQGLIEDIRSYSKNIANINIFVTEDNIEDILTFSNLSTTSSYSSILTEPDKMFQKNSSIKISTFLDVLRSNVLSTRDIRLSKVSITKEIWSEGDEQITSIFTNSYCYIEKDYITNCISVEDYPFLALIHDGYKNEIVIDENISVQLINYKYNIKYDNDKIIITTNGVVESLINRERVDVIEIIEILRQYLSKEFIKLIELEQDILNIDDFKYRNNLSEIIDIQYKCNIDYR